MNARNVTRGLVSVRADAGGDPAKILAELNKAVDEFRAENDARLKDIEKGMDDVVRSEKIERINDTISDLQAALDEVANKVAAQDVGPASAEDVTKADMEYAKAYANYMRRGKDDDIRALIDAGTVKASMVEGTDADGGYLAPKEWDRTITSKLVEVSPIRQIARTITISGPGFKKVYNKGGTAAGWVAETAARPETNTPQFGVETIEPMELYAMPAATQTLLDDAEINLAGWLGGEVSTEFARMEGEAFVTGDGNNKPKGLLAYTAAGSHQLGAIATVNSGDAAALKADGLIDLIYDVPSKFRMNARFIMNRKTQSEVRKFKDSNGDYLWQPALAAGQPSTLLGYPVLDVEDMPDVAADAIPVMFGDFNAGYLVVDRTGIRVLRDPFTAKPYILFYTTKRVGGAVVNPEALRYHKIAA